MSRAFALHCFTSILILIFVLDAHSQSTIASPAPASLVDVYLLIDRSGSIKKLDQQCAKASKAAFPPQGKTCWGLVSGFSSNLIDRVAAVVPGGINEATGLRVGLQTFDCKQDKSPTVRTLIAPEASGDVTVVNKAFEKLATFVPNGGTCPSKGLENVATGVSMSSPMRSKALILITDGLVDGKDWQKTTRAITKLQQAGVQIFAVAVGRPVLKAQRDLQAKQLAAFTSNDDSRVFSVQDAMALDRAVDVITALTLNAFAAALPSSVVDAPRRCLDQRVTVSLSGASIDVFKFDANDPQKLYCRFTGPTGLTADTLVSGKSCDVPSKVFPAVYDEEQGLFVRRTRMTLVLVDEFVQRLLSFNKELALTQTEGCDSLSLKSRESPETVDACLLRRETTIDMVLFDQKTEGSTPVAPECRFRLESLDNMNNPASTKTYKTIATTAAASDDAGGYRCVRAAQSPTDYFRYVSVDIYRDSAPLLLNVPMDAGEGCASVRAATTSSLCYGDSSRVATNHSLPFEPSQIACWMRPVTSAGAFAACDSFVFSLTTNHVYRVVWTHPESGHIYYETKFHPTPAMNDAECATVSFEPGCVGAGGQDVYATVSSPGRSLANLLAANVPTSQLACRYYLENHQDGFVETSVAKRDDDGFVCAIPTGNSAGFASFALLASNVIVASSDSVSVHFKTCVNFEVPKLACFADVAKGIKLSGETLKGIPSTATCRFAAAGVVVAQSPLTANKSFCAFPVDLFVHHGKTSTMMSEYTVQLIDDNTGQVVATKSLSELTLSDSPQCAALATQAQLAALCWGDVAAFLSRSSLTSLITRAQGTGRFEVASGARCELVLTSNDVLSSPVDPATGLCGLPPSLSGSMSFDAGVASLRVTMKSLADGSWISIGKTTNVNRVKVDSCLAVRWDDRESDVLCNGVNQALEIDFGTKRAQVLSPLECFVGNVAVSARRLSDTLFACDIQWNHIKARDLVDIRANGVLIASQTSLPDLDSFRVCVEAEEVLPRRCPGTALALQFTGNSTVSRDLTCVYLDRLEKEVARNKLIEHACVLSTHDFDSVQSIQLRDGDDLVFTHPLAPFDEAECQSWRAVLPQQREGNCNRAGWEVVSTGLVSTYLHERNLNASCEFSTPSGTKLYTKPARAGGDWTCTAPQDATYYESVRLVDGARAFGAVYEASRDFEWCVALECVDDRSVRFRGESVALLRGLTSCAVEKHEGQLAIVDEQLLCTFDAPMPSGNASWFLVDGTRVGLAPQCVGPVRGTVVETDNKKLVIGGAVGGSLVFLLILLTLGLCFCGKRRGSGRRKGDPDFYMVEEKYESIKGPSTRSWYRVGGGVSSPKTAVVPHASPADQEDLPKYEVDPTVLESLSKSLTGFLKSVSAPFRKEVDVIVVGGTTVLAHPIDLEVGEPRRASAKPSPSAAYPDVHVINDADGSWMDFIVSSNKAPGLKLTWTREERYVVEGFELDSVLRASGALLPGDELVAIQGQSLIAFSSTLEASLSKSKTTTAPLRLRFRRAEPFSKITNLGTNKTGYQVTARVPRDATRLGLRLERSDVDGKIRVLASDWTGGFVVAQPGDVLVAVNGMAARLDEQNRVVFATNSAERKSTSVTLRMRFERATATALGPATEFMGVEY